MHTTLHRCAAGLGLAFSFSFSLSACDEGTCDLYDTNCIADEDDEGQQEDPATTAGDEGDAETCEGESTLTSIDASDAEAWVRFDFDACERVEEDGPWELAFQRFHIAINGGVSGSAGLEAGWIEGVGLDDVEALPEDFEWASDEPDADDDGEAELVFGDWYDYDIATHVLSPKLRVYVLRSTEGTNFAVQIEDYYNEAGSSGHVALRWKLLAD